MDSRAHRLPRVVAVAALGVGGLGAMVGLAAGAAGAATADKITATSVTKVFSTGSNETAGDLTLTLANTTGATVTSPVTLTLGVPTGAVYWYKAPTVSARTATASATAPTGGTTATLTLDVSVPAHTTGTVSLTTVRYTTSGAKGTVTVTPAWAGGTFTPATAVDAYATTKTPATLPHTRTLVATSTPSIGKTSGQAAGAWTLTFKATTAAASAVKEGWTATETVTVMVHTPAGPTANCTSTTSYVLLTGTPSATVTATGVSTTPTVSVKTDPTGTECKVGEPDVATVTFTNSGTFTGTAGTFTITVSGVKYDAGTATTDGDVYVGMAVDGTMTTATNTPAPNGPSNADLTTAHVTANTPPVTVSPNAYDAAISPVKVVETAPGALATGYVCLTLTPGGTTNTFNPQSKATASVAAGNGVAASTVQYFDGSTPETAATAATGVVFHVTTASTSASTYEVSGLAVNAAATPGAVDVKVSPETGDDCTSDTGALGSAAAYTIGQATNRIYGATADATAVAELETKYPATGSGAATSTCAGYEGTAGLSTRSVVLVRDTTYPDALSSQYLAGYLDTGTLLTPTSALSAVTADAIRDEGVAHVYVVGGPDAVSTAVVAELQSTPVYACGGATTTSHGADLQVTRIAGSTEYGTAEAAAEYPSAAYRATHGAVDLSGAYVGTDATGGDGRFNTTAGTASTAPKLSGALQTAILATGETFSDAESASQIAYKDQLPILLTEDTALSATATAALQTLHVQQVIVMGGQDAVSNAVVTALQGMTISVLRVAGTDYTDTAVETADLEVATTATDVGLGWNPGGDILVARGTFFSDGMAGAVLNSTLAGTYGHPLLLTDSPSTVGVYLTSFLQTAGRSGIDGTAVITSLTVLGGPDAVQPSTVSAMQADLGS